MNFKPILEWSGCITGLSGALLLALSIPASKWAWLLLLLSSSLCVVYNVLIRSKGQAIMQLGFAFAAALGIWNCLLK